MSNDTEIQKQPRFDPPRGIDHLIQRAIACGASDAALVPSGKIRVEDRLADLCRKPRCPNYGSAAGCPPHVDGPGGFRRLLRTHPQAVVLKIDVPSDILLSSQRMEVFRLLHEIAAEVERIAITTGFTDSKAFAGGSCKALFCHEEADCRVISQKGPCRNPQIARPSMSGFGIDVAALMKAAGWSLTRAGKTAPESNEPTISNVCAMILLGRKQNRTD